jgi:hypothetical protein
MTTAAHSQDPNVAHLALRPRKPALVLTPPEPPAERALRLHQEAKSVSLEHLAALLASIDQAHELAQTVVDSGDLYAVGVHALSERLAEDLFRYSRALTALTERQRAPLNAH